MKKKVKNNQITKTKEKDNHHMDELKNEWSHYFIDPILLKPYEKRIQEAQIESNSNSTKNNENENNDDSNSDRMNKETKTISSNPLIKEILEDPECPLPIKSLHDKILKTIIIEEGINCLKNKKDNSIDFIFVKEFKN